MPLQLPQKKRRVYPPPTEDTAAPPELGTEQAWGSNELGPSYCGGPPPESPATPLAQIMRGPPKSPPAIKRSHREAKAAVAGVATGPVINLTMLLERW